MYEKFGSIKNIVSDYYILNYITDISGSPKKPLKDIFLLYIRQLMPMRS